MKIKKIECEQFAGIKDKKIEFNDNINIIYGKNESGKSTILELLHALLFQDAALKKNTDKDFISKNFPHNVNGKDGDVIDGKITIEEDGNQYVLEKEWEVKGGYEKLKNNDGTLIKNSDEIKNILSDLLKYEQGVYDEIVFSSQKLPQHTVESIFGECNRKDTDIKNELHSILMQSVEEVGGADIDAIENKILERISSLISRFDMITMAPEGGVNRPEWKKDVGEILKIYYDLKNAKEEKEDIEEIEKNIDNIKKEKKELVDEKNEIKHEIDNVDKYQKIIKEKSTIEGQKNYLKEVIDDGKKILLIWEKFEKDKKEIDSKKVVEVSTEDVNNVKKYLKDKQNIEAKFNALDLDAKIDNICGKELKVINVETGEEISAKDDIFSIKGCTEIKIPGIIDIKLMPKDVDVDELKNKYEILNKSIDDIFKKYKVKNMDELEKIKEDYISYQNKITNINDTNNTYVKNYIEKYKSIDDLKKLIEKSKEDIEKLNKDIEKMGEIPEEYEDIDDFDVYKKEQEDRIEEIDKEIENKNDDLQEESANLAGREVEPETIENLAKEYEAKITEYNHYKNIYDRFCKIKEQIKDNPMSKIEETFNEYLKQISNNNTSIADGSHLDDITIKSKNNKLTANTLSEGTKATISTAFKLSVIEKLFDDGKGLAIFDDPFTDMDEDRVKEACALIEKYSKNNQVIFVTCDNKYKDLFAKANVIEVSG